MSEMTDAARAEFDKASNRRDITLTSIEDFDGGKRREFTFKWNSRIFVIGVKLWSDELTRIADLEAASRAGQHAIATVERAERAA